MIGVSFITSKSRGYLTFHEWNHFWCAFGILYDFVGIYKGGNLHKQNVHWWTFWCLGIFQVSSLCAVKLKVSPDALKRHPTTYSQLRNMRIKNWVVVSNIFYFHPHLGKWSKLTNIFQLGWNHQLEKQLSLKGFSHDFSRVSYICFWFVAGFWAHQQCKFVFPAMNFLVTFF